MPVRDEVCMSLESKLSAKISKIKAVWAKNEGEPDRKYKKTIDFAI